MFDVPKLIQEAVSNQPVFESKELGEATIRDKEFVMLQGLDRNQVEQLRQFSLDAEDTALQESTSDYERFGTGDYEKWYSKKRTPFILIEQGSGALAALLWFGPKPLGRKSLKHLSEQEKQEEYTQTEDVWHTVSYRSYNPFRGAGVMKPFCLAAIEVYCALHKHAKLWLAVDTDNAASFALAEALGFKRDDDQSIPEEHHYIYIRDKYFYATRTH